MASHRENPWPLGTYLARLPGRIPAELLELGGAHRVGDGAALLRRGEPGTLVYLILQGLAKIMAPAGDGEQVLALRVRGDLVGEMAVLEGGGSRTADVVACGPMTVCAIRADTFLGYLRRRPAAGLALPVNLRDRLHWANRPRLEFAGFAADVCLARILLALADRHGFDTADGRDIGVPLTRAELGGLVGIKEATVQKAMSTLSDRGLIQRGDRRRVVVKDVAGLTRFAELIPPHW